MKNELKYKCINCQYLPMCLAQEVPCYKNLKRKIKNKAAAEFLNNIKKNFNKKN